MAFVTAREYVLSPLTQVKSSISQSIIKDRTHAFYTHSIACALDLLRGFIAGSYGLLL